MQQATRIIAIRHGETPWNVDGRMQGHTDIGLSDKGRWQAERVGVALQSEPLAAVFSSDLSRAAHTAEAVARHHGLPVTLTTGLRERSFGRLEGLTFAEVEAIQPETAAQWRRRNPEFAPEGGESLLQLQERILECVRGLSADFIGKQIAIVGHGGVLDMLYRCASGVALQAPRTWELGNATINRLLWVPDVDGDTGPASHAGADGRPRAGGRLILVGWNDDLHLSDDHVLDERTA